MKINFLEKERMTSTLTCDMCHQDLTEKPLRISDGMTKKVCWDCYLDFDAYLIEDLSYKDALIVLGIAKVTDFYHLPY